MQTITLQVQDNFIPNLLNMLSQFKDEVSIKKDKNLENDPYFYERQKQLQQDLKEVEDGTAEMISHNDLWSNINNHLKTLNDNKI